MGREQTGQVCVRLGRMRSDEGGESSSFRRLRIWTLGLTGPKF